MTENTTQAAEAASDLNAELGMWQPIETAPKDGTEVLLLLDCAGVDVVHIAWYRNSEEWESSGQFCGGWDNLEEWEGWWSYTTNSVGQEKLELGNITHWMPNPQRPQMPNTSINWHDPTTIADLLSNRLGLCPR